MICFSRNMYTSYVLCKHSQEPQINQVSLILHSNTILFDRYFLRVYIVDRTALIAYLMCFNKGCENVSTTRYNYQWCRPYAWNQSIKLWLIDLIMKCLSYFFSLINACCNSMFAYWIVYCKCILIVSKQLLFYKGYKILKYWCLVLFLSNV